MIFDSIKNLKIYAGTIPCTEQIGQYFARLEGRLPENGKKELLGSDLYVNVQEVITSPASERRWESHNDYADLQCLLSGEESYGTVVYDRLQGPSELHPEKDCFYYPPELRESGTISLKPGEFIYFAPGELHKPCCIAGKSCTIKKAVFKIRC